ncbi:MAG: hypothetical protein PHI34_05300 [Acidobacteriota bacterium]|nr:hypothetical protein [Acidobacteriota bacterium]
MRFRPFISVFFIAAVALFGQTPGGLIRVEAGISPLRLVRGQEGKVLLKVVVRRDILISPHPAFTIEFEPNEALVFPKPFFTATDLNAEVAAVGGRQALSFKKPLEIPFAVGAKAPRGVHVLKGKVTYYAISPAEGWCRKSTARFRATYSTRTAMAVPDDQIQP